MAVHERIKPYGLSVSGSTVASGKVILKGSTSIATSGLKPLIFRKEPVIYPHIL